MLNPASRIISSGATFSLQGLMDSKLFQYETEISASVMPIQSREIPVVLQQAQACVLPLRCFQRRRRCTGK